MTAIGTGALAVAAACAAFGCRTPARSSTATANAKPSACAVGELEQPLVIDWRDDQRATLADALRGGTIAVAYRCGVLHLVAGCTAPGHYEFAAITPVAERVRLDTADEVVANLPDHRGPSPIEIALVTAGRWSTIQRHVARTDLHGACADATHFVAAVDVGAASVASAARSATSPACAPVELAATAPPRGCEAALRVHLVALDSDAGDTAFVAPTAPCAVGRVWRDHKCTAPSPERAHQCHLGDAADCKAQCDRGHAGSCATFAVMIGGGMGVAKDVARATSLLQTACADGDVLACRHTADILASGEVVAKDEARAVALFARGCDAGLASSCTYLGAMTRDGRGVAADPVRGAALERRACVTGDRRGCSLFAAMQLGQADDKRVAALFADACTAGDPDGCNGLAGVLVMSSNAAPDLQRAAALFENACAQHRPDACSNLASVMLSQHRDEARALELLRRACSDGYEGGCELLAVEQLERGAAAGRIDESIVSAQSSCGSGRKASCVALERLRAQFATACDGGQLVGCSNLGQLLATGIGGATDDVKARALLRRACDGKIEAGCKGFAVTLLEGRGGPADLRAAMTLLHAGCHGAVVYTCSPLGRALVGGIGAAADARAALAVFQTGCLGGDTESCEDGGALAFNLDHDTATALDLFARGCARDRASSCSKQGALLAASDRARGLELLRTGCKRGDAWGCAQLKQVHVAP
jgi:TPR repeat protein